MFKAALIYSPFFLNVLIGLSALPFSTHTGSPGKHKLESYSGKKVRLTVFIHGMMNIKFHLSFSNAAHFLSDTVHNTTYAKTVDIMRQNPFFYTNQIMSSYGLHYIDPLSTNEEDKSLRAIAYLFDSFNNSFTDDSIKNIYYTFGWNGLLSKKERMWSACDLFVALEKEIAHLKTLNISPHIRIVGYSHGGSIALCLAHARAYHFPESSLKINELILLGTPIKKDIDYLINDPLFDQIYNFYSLRDRVQSIDLIARDQLFSQQTFKPRPGFILPKKLTQIRIKLMRLRNHNPQEHDRLITCTNNINNYRIKIGRSPLLRDMSPGHMELWFFGWTDRHYRSNLPLSPIPIVALVPYFINIAVNENLLGTSFTVDLRPENGFSIINYHNCQCHHTWKKIPFLDSDSLCHIRSKTWNFGPKECLDYHSYIQHVRNAFEEAQCMMKERLCIEKQIKTQYTSSRICTHDIP